jgi:hypothetical protein
MRSRLSQRVGVLVVVASLLVGTSVLAQSPFAPEGNPIAAVLAKLDQVIEMLAPPTPPAAGPVTLRTGPIIKAATDRALCSVANVSTATIPSVEIRLLDFAGETVFGFTQDVPPGNTRAIVASAGFSGAHVRCEFSFVGFADDVRATLFLSDATTLQPIVALDAR